MTIPLPFSAGVLASMLVTLAMVLVWYETAKRAWRQIRSDSAARRDVESLERDVIALRKELAEVRKLVEDRHPPSAFRAPGRIELPEDDEVSDVEEIEVATSWGEGPHA